MMRRWRWAVPAAIGCLVLFSCNGDDNGGTGPGDGSSSTIQVKPGAWEIIPAITNSGGSGCFTLVTQSFCAIYGEELNLESLIGGAGIACDVTVAGNQVSASCEGSITLSNCSYEYSGGGSGAFTGTRDSFSIHATVTLVRKSGSGLCPAACTYSLTLSGIWIGETCPVEGPGGEVAPYSIPQLFRDALVSE